MCAEQQYRICIVYWCFPEAADSLCLCCKVNLYVHSEHVWKLWTTQLGAQTSPVPRQRKFLSRKGRTCLRKSRCILALVNIEMKTKIAQTYQGQCLASFSFFGRRKSLTVFKKYCSKFSFSDYCPFSDKNFLSTLLDFFIIFFFMEVRSKNAGNLLLFHSYTNIRNFMTLLTTAWQLQGYAISHLDH